MITAHQLASSPVGREMLDELSNYIVRVISRTVYGSDSWDLWSWLTWSFADHMDKVPYALSGLDEGDLAGLLFQSGLSVSDYAYDSRRDVPMRGLVCIEAYQDEWPEPMATHIKLAEHVLQHPASRWWSEPWNARQQVWASKESVHDLSPRRIDNFGQGKPVGIFGTSSSVEGLASAWEVAAITNELNYEHHDSDFQYHAVSLEPQHPVFEIDSLADWVEICEMAPTETRTGLVCPDWEKISEEWSGVHLTVSGLIACQGVPVETKTGYALLHGWDIESTAWFEPCIVRSEVIAKNSGYDHYWPNHIGRLNSPDFADEDTSPHISRYGGPVMEDEVRFSNTLPPASYKQFGFDQSL